MRIAAERHPLDRRTSGKPQPEQLRRLVERFAERVVDRGAQPDVAPDITHEQKLRVAAGNEQQEVRRHQPLGEPNRERVSFQVIDRVQWLTAGQCESFGRRQPDE